MTAPDLPENLVDLQRSAHAAWDEVEAHRKTVDAERRASGAGGPLRPWAPEEDAEHQRLMGIARQAQQDLDTAIDTSGLGHGYEVVQALHAAARVDG